MRDELKAACFLSVLLFLSAGLYCFYHPPTWIVHPYPVAPSTPPPVDRSLPPARYDEFITRYGPPTNEEGSPHGALQPPLFTKWLDYEPEHLRIAFVSAQSSESPTGTQWVLISFVDSRKVIPISPEEAGQRLQSRQK